MDVFTSKQIEMVDFSNAEARRSEINAFVEDVTQNYVKDLLPRGSVNARSEVILVNAAFFKGMWLKQFKKAETHKAVFNDENKSQIDMMHVRGSFKYGEMKFILSKYFINNIIP